MTTYVRHDVINYFDSFSMPPFQEMVDHAKNLYSSTCGFFCLYFLNEVHKGVDYFDLLQVFDFDTNKNEKFIADYFKSM